MPTTDEIAASLQRIERQTAKITETIGILDERQKVIREDLAELKDHQKEANGSLLAVVKEQHEMRGAVGMLKVLVGLTFAGVGAGAALAGVILVLVRQG